MIVLDALVSMARSDGTTYSIISRQESPLDDDREQSIKAINGRRIDTRTHHGLGMRPHAYSRPHRLEILEKGDSYFS